jgi:hypothetical protein
MRRVTRNAVIGLVVIVVLLLALGALPGFLGTGDPYYVTATIIEDNETTGYPAAAVNGSDLSERRFPYTTTALRDGRSDAYYEGYVGIKEAFTHSPFDEVSALEGRNASAVTDRGVLVRHNGTLYTVAVNQDT